MIGKHSAGGELCLFALPMLIGNILQSGYSMVDMAIVGLYVGPDSLAAVGNTAMICFISGALGTGFTIGGNVMVARCRGAGRDADLRESISTLFALSAVGGLLLTGLNYALYRPLLGLMNVPQEALPHAYAYMDIMCAGNFFVFGYNAVCAVMRGFGDSKRPLCFVALAAAVNVGLDYALVAGLGWGVRGAALATVVAQAVACAAGLAVLLRRGDRYGSVLAGGGIRALFRVRGEKARELLRLGLPTALHVSVLNASYMVVTALFNKFGVAAAAAAGIGLKVNTFAAMPCWAIGQAVTTMAGHSLGAGDPRRAATIARAGLVAGALVTAAPVVGLHLLIRPFLAFFSDDPAVTELGVRYLLICCSVNFLPYCVMHILDSFAVGTGAPVFAMANSLLQSVVIRLGLSFGLLALPAFSADGFTALCVAEAVSPVLPCLIALGYFRYGGWRAKKQEKRERIDAEERRTL